MVRQEENGRKAGVEGETGQDDLALISGYPDFPFYLAVR